MKLLVITDDKYLYRRIEIELSAHTVTSNTDDIGIDMLIYDIDSAMEEPQNIQNRITLSRNDDMNSDLTLPLPLGAIEHAISEPKTKRARLYLHEKDRCAYLDGERIKLTSHEYALLSLLISGGENYTSREMISKTVWNDAADGLINIYIHYLREKLEKSSEKIIISSRKFGYKINESFLGGKDIC